MLKTQPSYDFKELGKNNTQNDKYLIDDIFIYIYFFKRMPGIHI